MMIDQTSPELHAALSTTVGAVFGLETIDVGALHTGGGCMVCVVDLSQDGRGMGRQLWLTREGANEWLLGFYDFAADEEDEGLCLGLRGFWNFEHGAYDPERAEGFTSNDPQWLAAQVAGMLRRLGVSTLQGG